MFTNELLRNVMHLKDVHLVVMVMTFFIIDVIILVTWVILSPLEKDYRWFNDKQPRNPTNADIIYRKKIVFCKMNHAIICLTVVYGTKTMLLLFGLFLAWETRKVKISALNDSQNTGMAVYNVVVMCFLGVPIVQLLRDELYEVSFIITTFCIMSCTTLTLCLVFVTKVRNRLKQTDVPPGMYL
ncbi:hypothetical protein QZH41_015078 [Actinostola sp. cb2023]|nr:hypothetical protein QZH41_015078 [Actinostola sp. cb2023]